LATFLRRASPRHVTVYPVALSDTTGTATLSLPAGFIELGSLEPHSRETWTTDAPIESYDVALAPLDSYDFDDVALIKIDVEGHEMALLQGATQTIARWRPSVLIEVEERHAPGSLAAVRGYFEDLNYAGYYLDGSSLRPIDDFDVARDQNVSHLDQSVKVGRYINNFMFFDRHEAAGIVATLTKVLMVRVPQRRLRLRPAIEPR
jgi:FkbM family methyltransferase